jgi:hypothetical protein
VASSHWSIPVRLTPSNLSHRIPIEWIEKGRRRWAHRREKFSGEGRAGGRRRGHSGGL